MLVPTRIYVKTVLRLLKEFHLHGLAHITGGGFTDNIPRIIPPGCKAVLRKNTWPVPGIFKVIQEGGDIAEPEMLRTFNNGIGMVLAVPQREAKKILLRLKTLKEKAYLIGEIVKADKGERPIEYK
jgi:phosphoribosylformylglycinamidine cyclo-ligase